MLVQDQNILKSKFDFVLPFDLCFFDGEKTEKATPKKRADLRKKGQVVQSKDINSVLSILFVFIAISLFSGMMYQKMSRMMYYYIENIKDPYAFFEGSDANRLFFAASMQMAELSLPFLVVAMLTGVIASYAQVGFLFTTEPLKFKLEKISMLKGFKRIFSMKSLVEMVKSILKTVLVLYVAYLYVTSRANHIMKLPNMPLNSSSVLMWDIAFNMIVQTSIILLVLAFLDYWYKHWQNERDIRMSKQDIKEEYKQSEGNPQIKSKIKEKQRQMATRRMMQDVKDADVVITNPTHFAVALKYDIEKDKAPIVVAKGQDRIALRIKEIAKEADIPVVENKPLARLLYKSLEIGDFIAKEHYQAVADVLAFVSKVGSKRKR